MGTCWQQYILASLTCLTEKRIVIAWFLLSAVIIKNKQPVVLEVTLHKVGLFPFFLLLNSPELQMYFQEEERRTNKMVVCKIPIVELIGC